MVNNNKSLDSNNRIQWIELGRCIAILAVILCHIAEITYSTNLSNTHYLNTDFMSTQNIYSKIFVLFAFTVGRLGVPIFLMITGYLLFDRKYDKSGCKKFYKKNFSRLLACTEIWIIIYNIFIIIFRNTKFEPIKLIKQMLFIEWVEFDHWWFMFMIIIAYLMLPLVANLIQHGPNRLLKTFFIIYIVYTSFYKIIDDVLVAMGHKKLPVCLSLGHTYGVFAIYMIIGYLIKKNFFKKINTCLLSFISFFAFIIVLVFQIIAYTLGAGFNIWYDCPFMLISTVAIFELLSRIKNIKFYNIVKNISYYSFGIYLIHIIIREVMFVIIPKSTTFLPLIVIIATLINFIITYVCVLAISKIPKIGKFLLYLR